MFNLIRINLHRVFSLLALTIIATVLTGCGGNGGGSSSSSSGGPAATETYLFYEGSLAAVDPANPGSPIDVELSGTITNYVTPIISGSYNSGTGVVSDLHYRTIVYEKSGNLYQVSALKSGSLTPTQVSTETQGTSICDTGDAPDLANPDNSRFYYYLPGADISCGGNDNILRMVNMGMTSTDTPVQHGTAGVEVIGTIYNNVGGITGWVILNGTQLQKFDADFGTPQPIANSVISAEVVLEQPGSNGLFLLVNDGTDDLLYRYDTTGTSLGAALHTFAGNIGDALGNPASDGSYFYFEENNAIFRVPVDGTATSAQIVLEVGAGSIEMFRLTANRVVYYWSDNGGAPAEIVRSVLKTGGATTNLDSRTADNFFYISAAGGSRVYYADWSDNVAVSVNADGTGRVEHTDSIWTGWTAATTTDGSGLQPSRVFLFNMTDPANPTLSVYDIANYTQTANFGVVPNAADTNNYILPNALANNNNTLYHDNGASGFDDIFFLNTGQSGSLVTVASNAKDESIVGSPGCSLSPGSGADPVFPMLLLFSVLYLLRLRRND